MTVGTAGVSPVVPQPRLQSRARPRTANATPCRNPYARATPEELSWQKTARASKQQRVDVLQRRRAWFEAQPDLDPERLVFVDETGASTKMARRSGRAPRGQRCRAPVPHGHWKTTTFVGALRLGGIAAPMVLDGAMHVAL